MMIRKFSVLFATLFCAAINCDAQNWHRSNRIITTDYNECLVGVKDTFGNWVILPQYTDVRRFPKNSFWVLTPTGQGVVDSTGKYLVSPIYQILESSRIDGMYRVFDNNRWGVVNAQNDTVVPIQYRYVSIKSDSVIMTKSGNRKWTMIYPDSTKKKLKVHSNYVPREVGRHKYTVIKPRWFLRNKYKLIGDSGAVILDGRYDLITKSSTGNIFIQKGLKGGYLSQQGKFIWPVALECYMRAESVNYWWERENWEDNPEPVFHSDSIAVAGINDKYGLITASGRTLLPFEFDEIKKFDGWQNKSTILWCVKKDDKEGIYEGDRGWLIEPEFDTLVPLSWYNCTDSSLVIVYAGRKNGHYGIASTSGQVIMPFIYKKCYFSYSDVLLYNNDTIYRFTRFYTDEKQNIIRNQLNLPVDSSLGYFDKYISIADAPSNKQFSIHHSPDGSSIYYHPEHKTDTLYYRKKKYTARASNPMNSIPDSIVLSTVFMVKKLIPVHVIGSTGYLLAEDDEYAKRKLGYFDMFVYHATDSSVTPVNRQYEDERHTYYRTFNDYIVRDDGIEITQPHQWNDVRVIVYYNQPIVFLAHSYKSYALVDTAGNYLIPPQESSIGSYSEKYMWINKTPNRSVWNRFLKQKWRLIDRSTGKTASVPFAKNDNQTPIWNDMTVIDSKRDGATLYNLNTGKSVSTRYNSIVALNDSATVFQVRTCSGKSGVIDKNGVIVLDTMYGSVSRFNYLGGHFAIQDNRSPGMQSSYYQYMCFYTDSIHAIIESSTGQQIPDTILTGYLFNRISVVDDTLTGTQLNYAATHGNYSATYLAMRETDSTHMKPWHVESLTDSITNPQRTNSDYYGYSSGDYISLCDYCEKKTGRYGIRVPGGDQQLLVVHTITDSTLSYCAVGSYNQTLWQTNIFLFDDGPRNMTLDSLFDPASDWRNFIINSVITYINSHLYVEGDCHNPAALPSMLNDRFMLTENGIELYPDEFEESGKQLVVTIPWEAATPYLRTDVKSKLPIIQKD